MPALPVGSQPDTDDSAMQVMGCLPRAYVLDPARESGAQVAIRIREEPGSLAGIYAYRTLAERAALIDSFALRWMGQSTSGQSAAAQNNAATPASQRIQGFFIAGWQHASARMADGSMLLAVFEDKSAAGTMCLGRANIAALRASLPVLGNWCMDRLRLWRED